MLNDEHHIGMPRVFLYKLLYVLLVLGFEEATVFLDGYSAVVYLGALYFVVAVVEFYGLWEHAGPEMLALIGAELAFGKGGEGEDWKISKTILNFNIMVIIDALAIGAGGYYT